MSSTIASTNEVSRVNLLGLTLAQMEQFFLDIGEKKFRAQQVLKWIHHSGVIRIAEMTNLGKVLRAKLQDLAEVRPPEIVSQQDSADGTR
jgi:23S rRNA (adenine2503-C2)-methyltransferase